MRREGAQPDDCILAPPGVSTKLWFLKLIDLPIPRHSTPIHTAAALIVAFRVLHRDSR